MDRAHREDYRVKRLFDDAARAIDAVLADEVACRRLGSGLQAHVLRAKDICEGRSEQIVRVWD